MPERSRRAPRARGAATVSAAMPTLTLLLTAIAGADAPIKYGDPVSGLTPTELTLFTEGRSEFTDAETAAQGLGPVFNNTSCAACHSSPRVGGDSNIVETRFGRMDGTTFDPMTSHGGSLLQVNGIDPKNGCPGETIPDDATIRANRKTTPLFGLGLVDQVPDATLQQLAQNQQQTAPDVAGQVSSVVDAASGLQRVGRFGWKAQVATLLTFSADAYLNEMGITSPIFPNDNAPNGDTAMLDKCDKVANVEDDGSGVAAFADFMTMLAPPPRGAINTEAQKGEPVFDRIGCAVCHVKELKTGASNIPALSNVMFAPFSDFLLHDMDALGDGIVQGAASGRQMRTAPLWGLGTRTRYLHDARASRLEDAIQAHDGQGSAAAKAFKELSKDDSKNLIKFLQSL
jgi:CxxC motif-containing protein (DUF1111 family)